MDRFDRALLKIVQSDATESAQAIGNEIGLSASAVQRRLKRLRDNGTIRRIAAVVEPDMAGKPVFLITSLEIDREHPGQLERLRRWLVSQPEVQQVYYVTGTADFILVIAAPTIAAYDDFMGQLMTENKNVRRFSTNVTLSVAKQELAIPLD